MLGIKILMTMHCKNTLTWIDDYINLQLITLERSNLGINWDKLDYSVVPLKLPRNNRYIKLAIPYANQMFEWEISFNPLHPELGPDIFFNDECFEENNINKLPHSKLNLFPWHSEELSSLTKIIEIFINIYKKYQIKLLEEHILKLNSDSSFLNTRIQLENVEVLVIQKLKLFEVKILIKLDIDFPPDLYSKKFLKNNKSLLFIDFRGVSCNRYVPEVQLSSDLEFFFYNSASTHLPLFHETKHILNYTDQLSNFVVEKISTGLQGLKKRKNFIATILLLKHESVIEYDIRTFKKISLLVKFCDIIFILTFTLPCNFPHDKFSVNIYYFVSEQGKPLRKIIQDIPYNEYWKPRKMFLMVLKHILENDLRIILRNCK